MFGSYVVLATDLLPTAEEELVRINAVCDGASDERHPVKDDWRFILVLEDYLREDIYHYSYRNEEAQREQDDVCRRRL